MRMKFLALLSGALVVVLSVGVGMSIAAGSPPGGRGKADDKRVFDDNLDGPKSEQQREDRVKGLEKVLKGKVKSGAKVVKIGRGRYVELAREKTDRIFVIIAEFGNTRHASFPDTVNGQPASDAKTFDGPAHNSIPKPDRKVDNSTLWQADYSNEHYQNMYFKRMANYYESQSSGRYSVDGDVTEWVKVPFNEARYGRDVCGGIVCNNTWFLIRDAMAYWVQGQLDTGKTTAQIADYLKTFDKWDRYDLDGDGNFDEPDGFIDHFQIVHAGGDQAAGDPQQGTDAIWSHRWYAQVSGGGPGGLPGVNAGQGGVSSGLNIPNNPTGVWVGDYTIQPENGGLGVFAHEYGHDLGLPDLYDTSGNTGGAENSTGFWTLMSSGANIGDGGRDGIGDAPTDMGAWEKFQLGWLGSPSSPQGQWYDVVNAGAPATEHELGPAEGATRNGRQALFVVLPDKEVPLELGAPCSGCGSKYFYSGAGDDYDASMTKTTGISGTAFTAMTRYEAEEEYDFGFLEASTERGHDVGPGRDEPLDGRRSERRQHERRRYHRLVRRRVGLADGHAADGHERPQVPVRDRPRRHRVGLPARPTRDRREGHRVGGEQLGRVGAVRLPDDHRIGDAVLLQRVRRREPRLPRVRRVSEDGLQLRVPRLEARLGRVVPVSGRAPDQLLGLVLHRQQRRRPSGQRPDSADRRPPDVLPRGRWLGCTAPAAHPHLRLDVHEAEDEGDHDQHQQQAHQDPVAGRRRHVRRHARVVVQQRRRRRDRVAPGALPAGVVRREGAEDGHDDLDQERRPAGRQDQGRRRAQVGPLESKSEAGRGKPRPARSRDRLSRSAAGCTARRRAGVSRGCLPRPWRRS